MTLAILFGLSMDYQVFLAFSFTGQRAIAEFGISLAAAVALDAFILRTVLVPAAMHLFGDANWWLPRWKDRLLPYLAIKPPRTRQPLHCVSAPGTGCRAERMHARRAQSHQ